MVVTADRIKGITIEIGGDTTGLKEALSSVNKEISSTQSQLKDVERLLKLDPGNTELLTQKQRLLNESVEATREKLEALKNAEEQVQKQFEAGEIGVEQYEGLKREIIETEEKLKNLEKQAASSNVELQKIGAIGDKLQDTGEKISDVGKKLLPVTGAVTALGAAAVKTTADFDAAMSKVSSVSGATGDDLEALRDKAREMGSKTKFSASEAAEAMNYMAMAGWKTSDMLGGIEGIMNLAAASGEDLATTSDIVTDALTAFGLSADDSAHFADILAAASSNANTNVAMMGETFKYAAPLAGAMGFSAEDTAEAIGLMANAGIKASQAGTSLRTIMTAMSGPIELVGDSFGEVTIETSNADGSMRALGDILQDLRGYFGELSESEQASTAMSIAGKNAMSGFLALMNAAPADIEKLNGAIAECDGTSEKMANTMQDNLPGQVTILKSQLEELAISFGEMLMPAIRQIVTWVQSFVDKLNSMDQSTRELILTIGLIAAAIGPLLIAVGTVMSKVGTIMSAIPKLVGSINTIAGSVTALSGPIGIAIAAIAALTATFIAMYSTNEEFREKVNAVWQQIKDKISSITSSISEILKRFSEIAINIWNKYGDSVTSITGNVFDGVASVIQAAMDLISDILRVVLAAMEGDWSEALSAIRSLVDNFTKNVNAAFAAFGRAAEETILLALNALYDLWIAFRDGVIDIVLAIVSEILNKFNDMKEGAVETFVRLKNSLFEKVGDISDTIIDGISQAVEWIEDLPGKAIGWGKDFIGGFVDGVKSKIDSVIDAVSDVAETVSEFLHFSRPDRGPLRFYEEWMPDMMEGLANGIRDNMWRIMDQVNMLVGEMSVNLSGISEGGSSSSPIVIRCYNQMVLDKEIIAESVNETLGEEL